MKSIGHFSCKEPYYRVNRIVVEFYDRFAKLPQGDTTESIFASFSTDPDRFRYGTKPDGTVMIGGRIYSYKAKTTGIKEDKEGG